MARGPCCTERSKVSASRVAPSFSLLPHSSLHSAWLAKLENYRFLPTPAELSSTRTPRVDSHVAVPRPSIGSLLETRWVLSTMPTLGGGLGLPARSAFYQQKWGCSVWLSALKRPERSSLFGS